MKHFKQTFGTALLIMMVLTMHSACNKDKDLTEEEDSTEQIQQSKDESFLSAESDVNLDEVNTALSGNALGKTSTIAGATVNDSSFINERKIVITYNGANANGTRTRIGEVSVQLLAGTNWRDAGAILKINYSNLVITNTATNKSVTLNGYHLVTNVNGGRAFIDTTVTHKIRGLMTVSFDNGTSRSWSVARKRIITHFDLVYNVEVRGDTTVGGISDVVVWGLNRNGAAFYTQIQQPIRWSSLCSGGPLSGVKVHKGLTKEVSVTFGVDEQGNEVTGACPFGYRVNWTNLRGDSKSAVIGY